MWNPTPFQDLNAVLRTLIDNVQAVLGKNFVAACLQGSFAVGDFDRHSDVDFIIVVEKELTADQVNELQEVHARIFEIPCAWAQHLEGSYFPREVLKDITRCGEVLWYLDNGSRSLIQSEHCNTLVVRWVVREHGVALAGATPVTLVDPIPTGLLQAEIRDDIHTWGREILDDPDRFNNRFYQAFIVLSYCRMLHDLQAGTIGSKCTGAEWAKANLDSSWIGLIDRTWAGRPNPEISVRTPADPADFQSTLEFVRYAMSMTK